MNSFTDFSQGLGRQLSNNFFEGNSLVVNSVYKKLESLAAEEQLFRTTLLVVTTVY